MDALIPIAITVVAIVIAWKVLTGIVKTVALAVILIAAAIFVFGGVA